MTARISLQWISLEGLVLTVMVGAVVCAGCSGSASESARQAESAADTPRRTLLRLVELRSARKYRQMPPLIVPQRGQEVVDTLLAVDDFLSANRQLCNWVRENIGIGLAQTIDQSYLGDDLSVYLGASMGVFSRQVEWLDESVTGEEATVSFTVDNRLPAKCARLRRIDGVWRYDPEMPYSDLFPAAFHDMARGLEQVLKELQSDPARADKLRDDWQGLVEKVRARLRRGVRLLSKAHAAAQAGQTE